MTGSNSALYLIVTQVASRGLTFIGNQLLLQYLSPGHLGLAVQLETLSTSILYTARESLRVALQRRPQPARTRDGSLSSAHLQSCINVAYLVIPLGTLLALVSGSWYFRKVGPEVYQSQDFELAFGLYVLATVLELCSEPFFVVALQFELVGVRARAETTASIARCLAACGTALVMVKQSKSMSVLPYAAGQVCYAVCLLLVYSAAAVQQARTEQFSVTLSKITRVQSHEVYYLSVFSEPLLSLAATFYGQSVFKWLLTQGDVLILSFFADLNDQGIFALASNYGGLASRLLFQPVEESSRTKFGRLLAGHTVMKTPQGSQKPTDNAVQTNDKAAVQALSYLANTLRGYLLLVMIPCISILPHAFPIMIRLLLGPRSRWNAPQTTALLTAYSYYIPLLAVNGILDAFVSSVATKTQLAKQSLNMIVVTAIYLAVAYVGMTWLQLGAVSLVYANMLNMILRIVYAIMFIHHWTSVQQAHKPDTSKFNSMFRDFLTTSSVSWTLLVAAISTDYLLRNPTITRIRSGQTIRGVDVSELALLAGAVATMAVTMLAATTERKYLTDLLSPFISGLIRRMSSKTGKTG